jgi:hypothetical protein
MEIAPRPARFGSRAALAWWRVPEDDAMDHCTKASREKASPRYGCLTLVHDSPAQFTRSSVAALRVAVRVAVVVDK